MYEADGIDLTESQYLELRRVSEHPGGAYEPYDASKWTCRDLSQIKNLIKFDERTMEARLTRRGRDWLSSYDASVRERKRLSKREWCMIAVNLGGGALLGGIVSAVVAVILHSHFGI